MTKLIVAFRNFAKAPKTITPRIEVREIRQPVINYEDVVSTGGRVPAVYNTVL